VPGLAVAALLRLRAPACVGLACLWVTLLIAMLAAAAVGAQTKTRVWDFERAAPLNVCSNASATQRTCPGFPSAQAEPALGSPHAARGAGAAHAKEVLRRFAERSLTTSGKHGVKWTEGAARAVKTGKAQGQFGSQADVGWVVERAHRIAPGSHATVPLPAGHSSFVHLPGGGTAPASQVFIKVYSSGKVHAYPLM
jgi:hypothetical protein